MSPASSLNRGEHFALAYCMYFFMVGTSSSPTPVVATRIAFSAIAAGVLLFPPVDDLLCSNTSLKEYVISIVMLIRMSDEQMRRVQYLRSLLQVIPTQHSSSH
jgi:hypothetical protein